MNYVDFNDSPKTPLTGASTTFASAEIRSRGVVAYHIEMAGTNVNVGNIARLRVRANGQPIVDVTSQHLRAFIQRFSRSNFDVATGDQRLTIPLYLMDMKGDARYVSQTPVGAEMSVEIQMAAFAASGTDALRIGWTWTDQAPAVFPLIIGNGMNIGAGLIAQRFNISQRGLLRALGLNTVGLNRVKFIVSREQRIHSRGQTFLEAGQMENTDVLVDPVFYKLHGEQEIIPGESYIEIDTQVGVWAGAFNELSLYSIVSNS